jgi:peptidyl-prolyl cis-trans isomerase D
MLQNIRDKSGSLFIKILLGAIIAAFALTGVVDIVNSRINKRHLATVGGDTIDAAELEERVRQALSRIQQQAGEAIPQELIKDLDLPQKMLESIIEQRAIESYFKKSNLVVTPQSISRAVESIPQLRDDNGNFRAEYLMRFLQNSKMSERMLQDEIRRSILTNHVFSVTGFKNFNSYYTTLFQSLYQPLTFKALFIPLSKVSLKETPTQEALEEFYNNNKYMFKKPEARDVSVIIVDGDSVKKAITVDDDMIKARYEDNKSALSTPETRSGHILMAPSREDAVKAAEKIEAGTPILFVEKDFNLKKKAFDHVERESLNPQLADAIFAQGKGEASLPILLGNEYAICVVSDIQKAKTPAYKEVKDQLREDIKEELAQDKLYELRDKIEEMIHGNQDLEEMAKALNLDISSFKKLNAMGKDVSQKDNAYGTMVAANAFKMEKDIVAHAVDIPNGGFFTFKVTAIYPSLIPSLEAIKEKVKRAYVKEKRHDAISQELSAFVEEGGNSEKVKMFEKTYGQAKTYTFSRIQAEQEESFSRRMGSEAIETLFKTPLNAYAYARTPQGYVLLVSKKRERFTELDRTKERKGFMDNMHQMLSSDIQHLMIRAIKDEVGVDINEKELTRIKERDTGE